MELQTISLFLKAAEAGTLLSGKPSPSRRIARQFFTKNWNSPVLKPGLPMVFDTSKRSSPIPNERIFEALGTTSSRHYFVACDREVNAVKARVWKRESPRDIEEIKKAVDNWLENCGKPSLFLKYMKATVAVFSYLNDAEVNSRLWDIHEEIRKQLVYVQDLPGGAGLSGIWEAFFM